MAQDQKCHDLFWISLRNIRMDILNYFRQLGKAFIAPEGVHKISANRRHAPVITIYTRRKRGHRKGSFFIERIELARKIKD